MLPEPWCQFCHNDDGSFDYDEWHAILCGIGDGLRPCSSNKAWELHKDNWHYYVVTRGITSMLWVVILILLLKGAF